MSAPTNPTPLPVCNTWTIVVRPEQDIAAVAVPWALWEDRGFAEAVMLRAESLLVGQREAETDDDVIELTRLVLRAIAAELRERAGGGA